ncbi:hypothetical protein, partial [Pseudomonas lurida]|uniref:hypothetical protein n=1 Tax=Pseudomonas lurida TaxID=244566 RepID=UPI0030DCC5FD
MLARDWPVAEIAPFIKLVEAVEVEVTGDSYRLSELQVRAILDLRLHRLTALGRDEIGNELQGLADSIANCSPSSPIAPSCSPSCVKNWSRSAPNSRPRAR